MKSFVKIEITPEMSDDEIRQAGENIPGCNNEYILMICRCGMFWISPDGNTKTAQIVPQCNHCY